MAWPVRVTCSRWPSRAWCRWWSSQRCAVCWQRPVRSTRCSVLLRSWRSASSWRWLATTYSSCFALWPLNISWLFFQNLPQNFIFGFQKVIIDGTRKRKHKILKNPNLIIINRSKTSRELNKYSNFQPWICIKVTNQVYWSAEYFFTVLRRNSTKVGSSDFDVDLYIGLIEQLSNVIKSPSHCRKINWLYLQPKTGCLNLFAKGGASNQLSLKICNHFLTDFATWIINHDDIVQF